MADHDLKGILDRVQTWGIAADNKVNVLTAVQAAVFAFVLPKTGEWFDKPATSFWMEVFLACGLLLLAGGLAKCVDAIFPRTKNTQRIKSMTFFGDINALSLEEYRATLQEMTPEKWREDYVSQIHTNAVIATRKHQSIKIAVSLFGSGIVVLGVCYSVALLGGW